MSLPTLHISLGVFPKFFKLLERECYALDFKITAYTGDGKGLSDVQINTIIQGHQQIVELESSIEDNLATVDLVVEAAAANVFKNPEKELEIRQIYEPRLEFLNKKISEKVRK